MPFREYSTLLERAAPAASRVAAMQAAVDSLWDAFSSSGVSWIGFYLFEPNAPEGQELVLGPRRDKPACSPIGLHGCCGRCFVQRRPLLVHDVATLGANYIACDPRDKSELVLPLFEPAGTSAEVPRCYGVLDADSYDTGSFSESDVAGMQRLMECYGLTLPIGAPPVIRL